MTKLRHKDKIIGDLRGKHLYKSGRAVQLFRNYDGFGMSVDVLDLFDKVTVTYDGKQYTARSEDFWEHGIKHVFGDDEQRILPRKFWTFKDKDQLTLGRL